MGKIKKKDDKLLQHDENTATDYDRAEVERDIQDTINRAEGDFLQRNTVSKVEKSSNNSIAAGRKATIDENAVKKAIETLKSYKTAKSNFDKRVVDNEEWWKMRHWSKIRENEQQDTEPVSAWLFNSIMNKLADYSDNYPEANIRARTQADVEEAERIKNILPMIYDANDYEKTYMDTSLSKIKNGTAITGVFWNSEKDDIDIQQIDVLSIFWQPGIKDIQASRNIFTIELVDNDVLKERYPNVKLDFGKDAVSVEYSYEDKIDTTDKSAVIDWYYKKNGILHYCKFVGSTVLFATENEPDKYPNGLYDDGNYPFVVDTLFKMEGTIAGFGYLDVCKSPQEYIDKLDQAIIQNAFMCARPRYFIRNDSAINTEEFLNWKKPLVKTNGNLGEDDLRQIIVKQLDSGVYSARDGKINELKQTSGNSDVSTGTTSQGVTAASAISQLIETGSKGSRHTIKGTYRAYRSITYMVIERMRQFYNEARFVRITEEDGNERFETYDNSRLIQQQVESLDNEPVYRMPQFDIEVSAQKSSPYNKMNQNELALQFYNIGFFAPQNADMALACLNMMDFDHKQEIIKQIKENGTLFDIVQQLQQQIAQLQSLQPENAKLRIMTDLAYGSNLAGGMSQDAASPEEIAGIDKVENSLREGDGSNSVSEQRRRQAASATEV